MVQKDKQLLFKDLCARLPYKVFITIRADNGDMMTDIIRPYTLDIFNNRNEIKPYLRPMSSMTSDERFEYDELQHFYTHGLDFNVDEIDWLLAHHFDFRGLIEKGLALEATDNMYNNSNNNN